MTTAQSAAQVEKGRSAGTGERGIPRVASRCLFTAAPGSFRLHRPGDGVTGTVEVELAARPVDPDGGLKNFMAGQQKQREVTGRVITRGPGPFVTWCLVQFVSGGHLVAHSRRHRKGLRPHRVRTEAMGSKLLALEARAFGHLWGLRRLGWWVAVLFIVGSACFTVGAFAAAFPTIAPGPLAEGQFLGQLFAVGAVFFTGAAWLQWLEALNGDVLDALTSGPRRGWRWVGWLPRNLGYLASSVQLVGTLLFNVSTLAATRPELSARQESLWIWAPNMAGCVCFLVASYAAYAEISHGPVSFAPRSLSWWIVMINIAGSVAFQISGFTSYVGASSSLLFWSNVFTMTGGACFLVGAYLLIPELFDEVEEGASGRELPTG